MIRSFRDMEVWQESNQLAVDVFEITKKLPKSEDYALTSQIRRSSNSISGNIAEGFGRRTKKDKKHFYTIARGSAFETQSHLIYGSSIGYFKHEKTDEMNLKYDHLIHQLNKIIKALT